MEHRVNFRLYPGLAGAYALAALGAALLSQFGFNLHPCELCVAQRWPYAAIGVIGVSSWLFVRTPCRFKMTMTVCALLYLLDAGIAGYHTGVEWGVFEGLESCSAGTLAPGASLEEIRRQLMEAPVVSCKDPMFVFLGLSMAGWNVIYALGGAFFCVWGLVRVKKSAAHEGS